MKRQIRLNVFETNSSSEHSVSVMSIAPFRAWQEGRFVARRVGSSEDEHTWGNFWSELQDWEFASATDAERFNKEFFAEWLSREWEDLEKNKSSCRSAYYDKEKERLNKMTFDKVTAVDKFYNSMYMTYEEYMEALRNGDCYSPFVHTDEKHNIVVFGTYFHS